MSTAENKIIVGRWLEERYDKGTLAVADESIAINYVNHNAPHGQTPGLEGEKQYITMIRSAFPDFNLTIEDQIAEGERIVTRCTARGTYKGGLEDIPSTAAIGKQVTVTEIFIHRIVGGKVMEGWIEFDQLGVVPSTEDGEE